MESHREYEDSIPIAGCAVKQAGCPVAKPAGMAEPHVQPIKILKGCAYGGLFKIAPFFFKIMEVMHQGQAEPISECE